MRTQLSQVQEKVDHRGRNPVFSVGRFDGFTIQYINDPKEAAKKEIQQYLMMPLQQKLQLIQSSGGKPILCSYLFYIH